MTSKLSADEILKQSKLPDAPPKCTWALDKTKCGPCPHRIMPKREPVAHKQIVGNVLEAYGHTPLIRLDKIAKSEGIECELVAKCEYFNAGGSIKDRIAVRMIEEAERDGLLKPGGTIVEPTSGNTGTALAMAAAVKGYRCILVMPDKCSMEKEIVMKALGAEVVRAPSAPFGTPDHYICKAHILQANLPGSHIFDQYGNLYNAMAHYDTTGDEIVEQCQGKIDVVVIGAGSCGTLSGVARKVKEEIPGVKVVAVDPMGSILGRPEEINESTCTGYAVEGIGKKFIPTCLDFSVVDEWIKMSDKDSFVMARRLIREEGMLCGGSSGTAVAAAVKVAKGLKKGQRVVAILPDSIRNYLTKFVSDDWMIDRGYMEVPTELKSQWWWDQSISNLEVPAAVTVPSTAPCSEVIQLFKENGVGQILVTGKGGSTAGVASMSNMTSSITTGAVSPSDPVESVMLKFETFDRSDNLGRLSRVLNRDQFAVVNTGKKCGIVTGINLIEYIAQRQGTTNGTNGMNGTNGTIE